MSETPIRWPEDGLIPCVVQDDETASVLMVGFMNSDALDRTRETGEVHFWSRSRNELWHKGGSSGHIQKVRSIAVNCDLNSVLVRVEQIGAVCHDGYASCYYRELLPDGSLLTTQDRLFDPRDVYGDGFGLQGLTRLWWGAFEWLKSNNVEAESGTSRILRGGRQTVVDRVQDELGELAGVLDGSHVHSDQHSDFLLEASQCCYWIVVECLLRGISWEEARPDRALDVTESSLTLPTATALLRSYASNLHEMTGAEAMSLFTVIAECARLIGINPRDVIERDLNELKDRPYLVSYFA